MEVILCEDCPTDMEDAIEYINKFLPEYTTNFTLHQYTNGNALLLESDFLHPDIFFLDIVLNDISGIEIAKKLKAKFPFVPIIFITCSREYIMDAFDVDASYYILKPLTKERFHSALLKAMKSVQTAERYLVLKKGFEQLFIPQSTIQYIETLGNQTTVYTANGPIRVFRPLKDIYPLINQDVFLPIQRGIITNMDYIESLKNNMCTLKNNTSYKLSRKNASGIREKYLNYLFQQSNR